MKNPKIALVLSGGASLGFAHVGVIEELLRENIIPDIVVGTSMGAVVGGAYACGISIDTYRHIYINIRISSVQCFFVAKLEYSNIN